MSRFRSRRSATESLGAGELSDNLPNQKRYPKTTVKSEIDTVSDFTSSGRRAIINEPGAPYGKAAGTRRHGGKRKKR